MSRLITTLGTYEADKLGLILPHEHIFVDLGPIEEANYLRADVNEVIQVMAPEIEKIQAQGVTALVECTPVGVGRRADIDLAVSQATGLPVVLPTGIYREPWIPQWAQTASQADLRSWMLHELKMGIEETGIQAAWIKVSAGDDGIRPAEEKILRAAAEAASETQAVIGSHTIRGAVVRRQLDIIEDAGYTAQRFIWIHTQAEPEQELHLEMLARGAWIEYDALGSERFNDSYFLACIRRVVDAGYVDRVLLSHDRGWYDPSKPGGGTVRPYTHLCEVFLPKLRDEFGDTVAEQITVKNPFLAYAR